MPISRIRWRQFDAGLMTVKLKAFASPNFTLNWLVITASPFCAVFPSLH